MKWLFALLVSEHQQNVTSLPIFFLLLLNCKEITCFLFHFYLAKPLHMASFTLYKAADKINSANIKN